MNGSLQRHVPVLAQEVADVFRSVAEGVVVDGTVGCGGHAGVLLETLPPEVSLLGLDLDAESLGEAGEFLDGYKERVRLFHRGYHEMDLLLRELEIESVRGILLDLGLSSFQLSSGRGFSYKDESELDMKFDGSSEGEGRVDLLKRLSVGEIARILREYGDVIQAGRCAAMIKRHLDENDSISASELAAISSRVVSRGRGRRFRNPATQIFQAIRIAVNRELENLARFLQFAPDIVARGCPIAVITYHSTEDRAVKSRFNILAKGAGGFHLPFRKGIVPGGDEIERNPRARSARMRILVRDSGDREREYEG
ncbi:MAG: 16S rRNA (cytosine(1402)-N(4))-methyltransferase RsmH [Deltaproteobacteria bacterium]|nr:16S rRNA (cytosine(1402)-N(4))-methyltransferase RsmH [Deltaproteobacteria bacterium]